jgi:hypothetical protein
MSLPNGVFGLVMEQEIFCKSVKKSSGTLVNHYDFLSIQNTVGVIHSQLENSFYSLHLTSFRSAPSVVDEANEIGANL